MCSKLDFSYCWRVSILFVIYHCFISVKTCAFEIVYPDFNESMLREKVGSSEEVMKRKKNYETFDKKYIKLFSQNYERNIFEVKNSIKNEEYRIPRIVHQIWLGSPVPEKFRAWMQTWVELKGWEYKLWTDETVKEFQMYNQDIYDDSINYGEKSDILRLEILSRYGGVYADTDYECLNAEIFEELHRNFDFYIGFEPTEHGRINRFNIYKVCNAIMGSIPGHPLIQEMIVNMKASYLAYQSCGVVERTGPAYYTRIICEYIVNEPPGFRTVYLPCSFFYLFMERELLELHSTARGVNLLPETAGIHYWSGSWHEKKEKETVMKIGRGNYEE